jgi:glycosyltransferase involved in cell wall biosynthesis
MATWGENFGHAIAEALQHGKPVIISDRTPWRNLKTANAGWDLPLEEKSFTEILRVSHSMNQAEYNVWSNGAKSYGHAHANDPRHLQSYNSLFA